MAATQLISLTRTADSVVIKVSVFNIANVVPHGSGALINYIDSYDGRETRGYDIVNETPAAILTAANA